ncbi:MAG: hypothetical protein JWM80_4163 [Cyanobacteria bacterium RYN_339]|nr:hypothetical protein [Cyanobacteria bacterium RYN_339]
MSEAADEGFGVGRYAATMQQEDGQGLAEYAVILTFVALVAIAGLKALGPLPVLGITQAAQGFKP